MKRLTWIISMGLLLGSLVAAPQKSADDAVTAIKNLEEKWTEAARKNDPTAVAAMLADSFVSTSVESQVRAKTAYLASMKDRKYDSAKSEDMKVSVYGDAAVATGIWRAKGSEKGKPFDEAERWTDTWIKTGGQWKCVASHSSALKTGK